MSCKQCELYRRKLSPLEDRDFTAKYKAKEPRGWLNKQQAKRGNKLYIQFNLPDLWKATFKADAPNRVALARLGRSLDALGWERTKRGGNLFFRMTVEEFLAYE